MKRLLALLLLTIGSLGATTLTGTLKNPDGTGANGTLGLTLAQQGALLAEGGCGGPVEVVPSFQIRFKITNGALPGGAQVYGNDCMLPAGIYYNIEFRDNNANLIFTDRWVITGASIDIGTIVSVLISGTTITLGQTNVLLTKSTGDQTIDQQGSSFLNINKLKITGQFLIDSYLGCGNEGGDFCEFITPVKLSGGLITLETSNSTFFVGAAGTFVNRNLSTDYNCASTTNGFQVFVPALYRLEVCAAFLTTKFYGVLEEAVGGNSPQFGTNGPMSVATHPYTWLHMAANDGGAIWVPAWR